MSPPAAPPALPHNVAADPLLLFSLGRPLMEMLPVKALQLILHFNADLMLSGSLSDELGVP